MRLEDSTTHPLIFQEGDAHLEGGAGVSNCIRGDFSLPCPSAAHLAILDFTYITLTSAMAELLFGKVSYHKW